MTLPEKPGALTGAGFFASAPGPAAFTGAGFFVSAPARPPSRVPGFSHLRPPRPPSRVPGVSYPRPAFLLSLTNPCELGHPSLRHAADLLRQSREDPSACTHNMRVLNMSL